MNLYNNKLKFQNSNVRNNFDNIFNSFITVFQIMTLERWQDILYLTMRSPIPAIINVMYLISWIFMGNYVLLNLFLAILFDGFHNGDKDSINVLEEDEEIHRLRKQKDIQKAKDKDKQLTLYLKR